MNEVMKHARVDRERVAAAEASSGGSQQPEWPWPQYSCWEPAKATGGGYIGAPVDGRRRRLQWRRELRLQLHLRDDSQEQGRNQGRDHLPRHRHQPGRGPLFPEIRLHGTVENVLVDPRSCSDSDPIRACRRRARTSSRCRCGPIRRAPTGPRTRRCCPRRPASSRSWCSTRVSRAAHRASHRGRVLHRARRGPLHPYTRAGYIEGGNIQVDNTRHYLSCIRRRRGLCRPAARTSGDDRQGSARGDVWPMTLLAKIQTSRVRNENLLSGSRPGPEVHQRDRGSG